MTHGVYDYVDSLARRSAKIVLNPLLGAFRPGNIAMLHVGRVGSTVLASMLSQHRRISWAGEVFREEHVRYKEAIKTGIYVPVDDSLRILREKMRNSRSRIFGFSTKFMEEHDLKVVGLNLKSYLDALSALGFNYFVVVTRRNTLRRLVSGIVLRETGVAHLRSSDRAQRNRIFVDVNAIPIGAANLNLIDAIQMIETEHERLADLLKQRDVCYLNYEDDICDDPLVAYRKVAAYVGIQPTPPEIRLQRTNPHPLSELIENFSEVDTVLSGSPYHWMLEKDVTGASPA